MDYSFEAKFNKDLNSWEVSVSGEIDIFNSESFKESVLKLLNEVDANLLINCKRLEFIDSTALGALVAISKVIKEKDGEITLIELKPSIGKLFKITNLDKIFKIEGVTNE